MNMYESSCGHKFSFLMGSSAMGAAEEEGTSSKLLEVLHAPTCSLGNLLWPCKKKPQLAHHMIKDMWPHHLLCPNHQSASCLTC